MLYQFPFKKTKEINLQHIFEHKTKKHVTIKFILLIIILSVYTTFLAWEYGWQDGGVLSIITWSFFVLCTPIADAGFLLDFPLRLLFQIRMLLSEFVVWVIAISINILFLIINSNLYDKLFITHLFKKILLTPFPYWGIIILSGFGTFLSVQFSDELIDLIHHKDREFHHKHNLKLELIIIIFLFALTIVGYITLLDKLHISIPK